MKHPKPASSKPDDGLQVELGRLRAMHHVHDAARILTDAMDCKIVYALCDRLRIPRSEYLIPYGQRRIWPSLVRSILVNSMVSYGS